ncbi:hypothetical protein WIL86_18230, partial [Vibrio cholerae]
MITVQQQDAATLTIVSQMTGSKELDLHFYLFIPGELDISPEVISESEFFYSSIHQQRARFTAGQTVLVYVYTDKASGRIVGTTKFNKWLDK